MVLERVNIVYCGACGMPPEYCEYGPDFETHCLPWLVKHHPALHAKLKGLRTKVVTDQMTDSEELGVQDVVAPTEPWTIEERLVAFYEKYMPEKVDSVPALLEKYAGKEDKLFEALVKKYGPEPDDPYYLHAEEEEDDDEVDVVEGDLGDMSLTDKKKRRGVGAKRANTVDTRVVIQKIARKKRKAVTMVVGMDTVPGVHLKDIAKEFSKRFAGSSSVKDGENGKEIIIQGDHMEDVAELIVKKYKVPASSLFLDVDGDFVPYNE